MSFSKKKPMRTIGYPKALPDALDMHLIGERCLTSLQESGNFNIQMDIFQSPTKLCLLARGKLMLIDILFLVQNREQKPISIPWCQNSLDCPLKMRESRRLAQYNGHSQSHLTEGISYSLSDRKLPHQGTIYLQCEKKSSSIVHKREYELTAKPGGQENVLNNQNMKAELECLERQQKSNRWRIRREQCCWGRCCITSRTKNKCQH